MEKEIAKALSKIMREKKLNTRDLFDRGINQQTYQRVLQIGANKGDTYTSTSLKRVCKAIGINEIQMCIDGNNFKVKF